MNDNLSIIIVSCNTGRVLARCLEAVYATKLGFSFQVLVVDNASSDGSADLVRQHFPQAQLIDNSQNVGFARANNQAILLSCGQLILLLNSDAILPSDALERMVRFMDEHPEAGILGAYILNADGTPQWSFGKFPTILSETITAWGLNSRWPLARWFGPQLGFSDDYIETDWVLGAALMIRREALDQAGTLDEGFFMYSEEIDLAYRVKKAGWKNYVLHSARIIHLGQQSTRQVPASMNAELFRSKVRYFLKHRGWAAAQLMKGIFAASMLSKWWGYRLLGKTEPGNLWAQTWEHYCLQLMKR